MGFFRRRADPVEQQPPPIVLGGNVILEVVGESYRQNDIWKAIGMRPTGDRVDHETTARLVCEPTNQYDRNAVAIKINGYHVGYLSRDDAADYCSGVEELAQRGPVVVRATVQGGGRGDGVALLGVFLYHDPADFGVEVVQPVSVGRWRAQLDGDTRRGIAGLRRLLEAEESPLERHFMWMELEERLYKLRDVEPGALDEFDVACLAHHGEMPTIRPALIKAFDALPNLTLYKQQCVRQAKAKNFGRGLWWAEQGLDIYGSEAHSQDWTDDLTKRMKSFRSKLSLPDPD